MRVAINSPTEAIFTALNRSYLMDKVKELARIEQNETKNNCGFSGFLVNFATMLKESFDSETGYGGWLKKS